MTACDFVEPIKKVENVTQKLLKGERDIHIDVDSQNELGAMADNLNHAIEKIREYISIVEDELGEAGRGFAVVADQIGKLAADSDKSAINTRELIAKTLSEIEQGNTITMKTA